MPTTRISAFTFLLTLAFAPVGASNGQDHGIDSGNYYALLFAGDAYENWGDLVNPIHDARTLGEELEEGYGFEVELVENPTQEMMLAKVREYAERTYDENDHLLIFYAGHGKFDEIDGEGYIVPTDAQRDDLTNTSYIPYSQLRTRINNIPSKHILLVLDACFGGTFDTRMRGGEDPYADVARSEFISRKLAFTTRRYITSGGKEYVPDGRPGHHSPFMRRMLESLRTYGGSDAILTLGEIQPALDYVDPLPIMGDFGDNQPGSDFLLLARAPDDPEAAPEAAEPTEEAAAAEPEAAGDGAQKPAVTPPSVPPTVADQGPEDTTGEPAPAEPEAAGGGAQNATETASPGPPATATVEKGEDTQQPTDDAATSTPAPAVVDAATEAAPGTAATPAEEPPSGTVDEAVKEPRAEDVPAQDVAEEEEPAIDSTYANATNTLVDHVGTIMEAARDKVPATLRQTSIFLEATGLEARGKRMYNAGEYTRAFLLFDEAKSKYEEAARAPKPQQTVSPALQRSIDGFVSMLKSSLEGEDVGGMGAMFYLDRDWTTFFTAADDVTAVVRPGPVQPSDGAATLVVEVDLTYLDAEAKPQEQTLRHLWMLQDMGDDWILTRVRPQP